MRRMRELALLVTRYGRHDFRFDPSSPSAQREDDPEVARRAEAFASELQRMGPTFIKFGQLLSTRPDVVPTPYINALERLQDNAGTFPLDQVEATIERELQINLKKAFVEFDPIPIAAASLGQVHRAVLRDGRAVVVKVQRPGVRAIIDRDLDLFDRLASFLERHSSVARKMNLSETNERWRRSIMNELDYLREARNAKILAANLAQFEEIRVPEVIESLTTERVLTTELVEGIKLSQLTPLDTIEADYSSLAGVVTRAWLKQICVDGFWHSDPHPGNIFLADGRLLLLDYGMVARFGSEFRDEVVRLLLSLSENRGVEVAESFMKLGRIQEGFDRETFVNDISKLVTEYFEAGAIEANAGQLLFTVIATSNRDELQVPSELAMLAKTLLQLDGVTRTLDPDFRPREVIRDYAESLVTQVVRQRYRPRNFYGALLDLNRLMVDLPRHLRDAAEQLPTGRLTVNVRLAQADDILNGMQKVANRVTIGLIIAGLIVGSAILGQIPTRFTIFGYPLLAVVGFLAASAIGFYFVISVLMTDRKDREHARTKMK